VLGDVLGGGRTIAAALERFRQEGRGVLVYLRDGAAGVPAVPVGTETASEDQRQRQWREVGLGAQILRELGVRSILHLTSTPRNFVGLSGFGIEIVGSEPA